MTEIVIQGIGGRMGHVLCDMIAQREDCRVVAGIDMKDGEQNGIPVYDSLEKLKSLISETSFSFSFISSSTYNRYPLSEGILPADVCG